MQNLVYLIIMVLAGGAGWYGGSWKGRDAIAALDQAKAVGEQAIAERDKLQTELKQSLAKLTSEFEQGQQLRDAEQAKVTVALNTALAGRDKTIDGLRRMTAGKQSEIQRITAQIADKATAPSDLPRLQAEIERLNKEVKDKETQIAGFECSKVPVPAELLQPLRGS